MGSIRLIIAGLLRIRFCSAVFQVVDAAVRLARGVQQFGIRKIDHIEETVIQALLVRRASRWPSQALYPSGARGFMARVCTNDSKGIAPAMRIPGKGSVRNAFALAPSSKPMETGSTLLADNWVRTFLPGRCAAARDWSRSRRRGELPKEAPAAVF